MSLRRLPALLMVAVLAACGGEERPAPSAPEPLAPAPAPAPSTPTGVDGSAQAPPAAPAGAVTPASLPPTTVPPTGSFRPPAGNLRGEAARGQALYLQFCSSCHGATGAGDGPASVALNPRPANHQDAQFMGQLTDEHLYIVIHQGAAAVGKSPLMVGWGAVIPDQDIRDLIAHLRQISGT